MKCMRISINRGAMSFPGNAPPVQSGFTLIELIAVVVILAVLAVTATASFLDLRRDSRIAMLNQVAATLEANAQAARGAWQVQRGGTTATVNGIAVEVFDDSTLSGTMFVPDPELSGFPTALGLARMLGCVPAVGAPSYNVQIPCLSNPSVTILVANGTPSGEFYYVPYAWAPCAIVWRTDCRQPSMAVLIPSGGEHHYSSLLYESAC